MTGALVPAATAVRVVNPGPIVATDLAGGAAAHRIGSGIAVFAVAFTALTLLRLTRLRRLHQNRDLARGHSG